MAVKMVEIARENTAS